MAIVCSPTVGSRRFAYCDNSKWKRGPQRVRPTISELRASWLFFDILAVDDGPVGGGSVNTATNSGYLGKGMTFGLAPYVYGYLWRPFTVL